MHKMSSLWKSFGNEPVNEPQKLLQSAEYYFFIILSQIEFKKFLVRPEIL